jgi:hypothetical protein
MRIPEIVQADGFDASAFRYVLDCCRVVPRPGERAIRASEHEVVVLVRIAETFAFLLLPLLVLRQDRDKRSRQSVCASFAVLWLLEEVPGGPCFRERPPDRHRFRFEIHV